MSSPGRQKRNGKRRNESQADSHLVDDKQNDTAAWNELLKKIGMYMELLFILNSRRDKEVWQYIVGVAAHLEYLAAAILWVGDGKPGRFEDYEDHLPLGSAISKIKSKGLVDPAVIEAVRAINGLRNSVAHRGAVSGVTVPGNAQRGVYKGGHVFTDLEAFQKLVSDADEAITAMSDWLRKQGAL